MKINSFKIAFTGIIIAFAEIVLLGTGLFPFATYALPAVAGMLFMPLMVEFGGKNALLAYIATAFLSFMIVPDKEAVIMFVALFGHYPITKAYIERVKSRVLEYILKFVMFNVIVISAYSLAIYVFGLSEFSDGLGDFGEYTVLILLALGNITFFLYDYGFNRIVKLYIGIIKPRFIDKLNRGRK